MPIPGLMGFPRSSVEAGPTVRIRPARVIDRHSGLPGYAQELFTLSTTIGTPTSYTWLIVGGFGTIISGQGTEAATIKTDSSAVIRCAVVIAGITYNPEASIEYLPGGGGSGGELF